MAPTLNKGESTIIERIYKYQGTALERYDLVAVVPPFLNGQPYKQGVDVQGQIGNLLGFPGLAQDPLYMRRIIALPGETVAIKKNLGILVDGKLLEENAFTTDKPIDDVMTLGDIVCLSPQGEETKPYGDSDEPIVVPQDQFFVMPDHRNNYEGSDKWGFVSNNRIIGKIDWKYGLNFLRRIKTPKLVWANEKVDLNDEAVRALDREEFATAIDLLNQAIKIDKDYTVARDNLSVAYNNYAIKLKDKPEAAIDKLHKALFIDPNNELTKKNLDRLLELTGRDPNNAKVRYDIAEKAFHEKRFIDALVEYREALKLEDNNETRAKIEQLEAQDLFPKEHFVQKR